MAKPKLRFLDIWNMSFGFLGIQFGFALQGGFMSHIYVSLGVGNEDIPELWLAAPLAGLIVQPIIGYLSDRTWHPKYGRRKPYFLVGALLSFFALLILPHSPTVWFAAGGLLVLDASINISMEPFRALVADKLPESQRSYGFITQTLIIGVGTFIASQLPLLFDAIGIPIVSSDHGVPLSIKLAFGVGAIVLISSMLYTIFTTSEEPPADIEEFLRHKKETAGFLKGITEIIDNIVRMPSTMRKLGVVQFFSWFAFFTMWSMSTPALTEHVFNAPKPQKTEYNLSESSQKELYDKKDAAYNVAASKVGSSMGYYGLSSMVFALLLTVYTSRRRINRKYVHMISLILGGLGFLLMYYTHDSSMLKVCYLLIGLAWGSILSMPYAMLSSSIDPNKMGVFMGLFNMFIVLPQIVASVGGINFLYKNLFGDGIINTMLLAGACLILAGLSNFLITERRAITYTPSEEVI